MIQGYIGAALVAFGGGWTVHSWKSGNDHKKALEAAVSEVNGELDKQKTL